MQMSKDIPTRSRELPATQAMVFESREELKAEIRSFRHENNSRFNEQQAQFKSIDAKINGQDAKFKSIEAKINGQDAKFKSIDARFNKVDEKFKLIDARFDKIDERFKLIDARFDKMEARFDKVDANIHEIKLLVEEQNANNKYVLDALVNIYDRQERVESKVDDLERIIFKIHKP